MSGTDSRRSKQFGSGTAIYVISGTMVCMLFISPLIWAVLRSFEPPSAIASAPSARAFTSMTVSNYTGLLTSQSHLGRSIGNSLIVAVATSMLTAVAATLAGYGLGRFRFRGSGLAFALILVTLMVPFQALLTPLFIELHWLHLINSLAGLTLFYSTFNLPFGVFVMRNTFLQIPRELEDSARVDGASTVTALFRVYRPIVVPGIATTVLYAFLFSWTEFLGALTFLTNENLYTLPVALLGVELGTYGQVNYGYLIAGAVIAMIPCILLFVGLQRFYIRGLTSGAVKG